MNKAASAIARMWARNWMFRRACPCAGCCAILASDISLDIARRIASREMVLS